MEGEKKAEPKGGFKPIYAVGIVVVIAVIAVAYFAISSFASPGTVAVGDNVSVYYKGSFANGTVFSTNVGQSPINFTVGSSAMIQGFDQAVVGMQVGQNKTVTVPPSEGYGAVNQSLIVSVPASDFGNTIVTKGQVVTTTGGQEALVTNVTATNVTVDFNPPLAGKTLVFQIQVVRIKK